MEERRYPVFEEEGSVGKACEPVGASSLSPYADAISDSDVSMPVMIPASYEEALADIDQSEREFREGRGIAWESVKLMIEDRIRNYAH